MDLKTANRIIELYNEGKSSGKIALILDKGESTVQRYIKFLQNHGPQDFVLYHVKKIRPKFTDEQIADIVEYAIVNGYGVDTVACIFKCSRKILASKLKLRIAIGKPLYAGAKAAVPTSYKQQLIDLKKQETIKQHNKVKKVNSYTISTCYADIIGVEQPYFDEVHKKYSNTLDAEKKELERLYYINTVIEYINTMHKDESEKNSIQQYNARKRRQAFLKDEIARTQKKIQARLKREREQAKSKKQAPSSAKAKKAKDDK